MKRLFKLFVYSSLCLTIGSCKSKEERISSLIENEMIANLYDYSSYEVVETQIDSAFNLIDYDEEILSIGKELVQDFEQLKNKRASALANLLLMSVWYDSNSYTGVTEYNKSQSKASRNEKDADDIQKLINEKQSIIREKSKGYDNSFLGWKVTHVFKCKNKGGELKTSTLLFIIDESIKTILYQENVKDESIIKARERIQEALDASENDDDIFK